MSDFTEDALIEQPAIALFGELGWDATNCFHEFEHTGGSPLGRKTPAEVVLVSRLRPALEKLNPGLAVGAITSAIEELMRNRGVMSPAAANREVYRLIKDGVKVKTGSTETLRHAQGDKQGEEETVTVKIIDWDNPKNNDFFLAKQFWISGEMYKRRADLVGFVNGFPLVFIELKASTSDLRTPTTTISSDYKDTIPQLFWYNAPSSFPTAAKRDREHDRGMGAFCGVEEINSEGETGRGLAGDDDPGDLRTARLLDIVENFILFERGPGRRGRRWSQRTISISASTTPSSRC